MFSSLSIQVLEQRIPLLWLPPKGEHDFRSRVHALGVLWLICNLISGVTETFENTVEKHIYVTTAGVKE